MAPKETVGPAYGMVADFDSAQDIYEAAGKVREKGFTQWECFTPFMVHGLDKQMGMSRSKVPVFTFLGGTTGFFTGMLIVWYMNAFDYPLIVGGKPFFSPVFPFPVFYELTILLAAFGTFFGMFLTNRLPRHNHPIFEYERFAATSDDKFSMLIESSDAKYDEDETKALLKKVGGKRITIVREES
ncbi:MAG: hypothetical protein CMI32_02530 [Opitutales bacterium]|nr:hypothetical protein [Opitutales bacterium]